MLRKRNRDMLLAAVSAAVLSHSYAVFGHTRLYGGPDTSGPLLVSSPSHDPRATPPYKSPAYVGSFGGQQRYPHGHLSLHGVHHSEGPYTNHVSGEVAANGELGHSSGTHHGDPHQMSHHGHHGAPLEVHGHHGGGSEGGGGGGGYESHIQHVHHGRQDNGHHGEGRGGGGDGDPGGGGPGPAGHDGGPGGDDPYGPPGPHETDGGPGSHGDHGYGGPNEIGHDDYYDEPHRAYGGGSDEVDGGGHHGGPQQSDGPYGGHHEGPSGASGHYGGDEGGDPHGTSSYGPQPHHSDHHGSSRGHHQGHRPRHMVRHTHGYPQQQQHQQQQHQHQQPQHEMMPQGHSAPHGGVHSGHGGGGVMQGHMPTHGTMHGHHQQQQPQQPAPQQYHQQQPQQQALVQHQQPAMHANHGHLHGHAIIQHDALGNAHGHGNIVVGKPVKLTDDTSGVYSLDISSPMVLAHKPVILSEHHPQHHIVDLGHFSPSASHYEIGQPIANAWLGADGGTMLEATHLKASA